MRLAEETGDPALLVQACEAQGWPRLWLGDLVTTRLHVERGIELYKPEQHRTHAFRTWQDPKMACLSVAALTLWELGYPQQALKRSQESLRLVRELSHTYSLAAGFGFAAMLSQLRRDTQEAREQAEMAISLATEHGFLQVLAFSTVFHGWALADQGQEQDGIEQLTRGIETWKASGAGAAVNWFLTMLAEAYGSIGQYDAGLMAVAEALNHATNTGERFYEAEIYRLKGELTLQHWSVVSSQLSVPNPRHLAPNTQTEAERETEECFLQAIDIARKQQAKSLELRATMSLARLWRQQGKRADAHQMLSEVYNWFTEGFDTKDLQEAKVLLEELSQ